MSSDRGGTCRTGAASEGSCGVEDGSGVPKSLPLCKFTPHTTYEFKLGWLKREHSLR